MLKGKQLLCLVMSAVLLFVSAGPVFAAENEPAIPQEQATEVTRVEEIVAWRETDSETYLLSDGTYECVIYAGDKYYRDATNTLQLIDNSIILDAETAQTTNRQYKNAANAFALSFSESEKPEITLAQAGKSITFSALTASGGNSNHITMDDTVVRVGGVQNCAILNEMTDTGDNTITYSNAFYNSDLVYVVKDHSLKEYIILENIHAPNTFSFLFEMEGLTLESFGDAARFVDDTGNPVFTLDSLFAVDANGVFTDALTYDFFPVKDTGDVIVTVILDETFLQAEDRAFPVVIDPTIMISSSSTMDACVCSNHLDTNYRNAFQLRTGYDGNDYGKRRSYIRFNIPTTIPPGGVTYARLDLEKISGVAPTIKAYRCAGNWSSSDITWSNQPDDGDRYGWYSSLSVPYRTGSSWYVMDVTEIVQSWANRSHENYGFVLEDITEDDPNHWTTFYSSDADSPHKPELHITYEGDTYQYIHYYDNSFSAARRSQIEAAVSATSEAFRQQFGITFSSKGSPQYMSVPVTIRNGNNNIHNDAIAVSNTLLTYVSSQDERVVLWTNYPFETFCTHTSEGCSRSLVGGAAAFVYNNRPAIHIFTLYPENATNQGYLKCMSLLLMHETAHTLGISDQFDAPSHSPVGIQCVMEESINQSAYIAFYDAIQAGTPAFCEDCENALVLALVS